MKVLIVDDNEDNLYLLKSLLKGTGHEVVCARDGIEALDCLKSGCAELVISDILMPRMDGFQLCRAIRSDESLKNIPFVIYTATYTDAKDEQLARSLGAELFLVKPMEPIALRQAIDGLMEGRATPTPADNGEASLGEDMEFLKLHNQALFRKLEKKMGELRQEIAERKQIESELAYRNSILATQQEMSLDGILVVDDRGQIISFNRRFAEIWNVPIDILTGKSDESAIPHVLDQLADPDGFIKKIRHLYDRRDETSRDLIHLKNHHTLDRYSSPMKGADGRYLGRVWYFRDVTEQKHLQAQLIQAQKMEALGTLAGGITHDFNNILSAILGYAELVQMDTPAGTKTADHIGQCIAAANRAKDLVRQILTFSRRTEQKLQPVQMDLIVKEALKLLRASFPSTIEIRKNVTSTSQVLADPTQLHQLLMNLCTNASLAMKESGGLLEVTLTDVELDSGLSQLPPGPYLQLTVRDTGEGMTQEVMERIFEPFFTTRTEGEGTGLGLSVVHGIVTALGGAINVSSQLGKETLFTVHLPMAMSPRQTEKEQQTTMPPGTERILFVDDEPLQVNLVKHVLERCGYRVTACSSSTDALAAFRTEPGAFDLLVTDMTMPRMTGDVLARLVWQIRPNIPVILCSGYSDELYRQKAESIGVREFIAKPIRAQTLAETVRRVLDQHPSA